MPAEKDTIFATLAVERGYATQAQVDEALAAQKAGAQATGVTMPLSQLMVGKGMLTRDQAQELVNAVAVETGEAHLVAGYEVIAKLGQGGMGAVYKARRAGTEKLVALKLLPPSLADDEMVARFRREAEIVRKLDHDNIVGCVEFGFDKQRKVHFCALELVDGEDLGKRIERLGKLTEKEAASIASHIAQALQHACFNGLIHRDVKPENIMVTPDGTAKLLDLGLARPSSTEATRMTQSGLIVGSPYYISPEQAMAERDIDIRADIYSLGATLYHMVTGRPPFEGGTVLAILQKHVAEKLPWPAEVNPELSDGFCRIVAKMMAKAPADRYQTPNDVHAALGLLEKGEEPAVSDRVLRRSSIMYGVRRRRPEARRTKPEQPEMAKERGAKVAAPPGPAERRRAEGEPMPREKASGWAALPTGAKIGIPAGAGVVAVVVLAVLLSDGEKPVERRPEAERSEAGQRIDDTRKASPPAKPEPPRPTAADALGEARRYEESNPDDLAGIMARWQAVVRDFPGTREGGEAEVRLARLGAKIAATAQSERGRAEGVERGVPASGEKVASGEPPPPGRGVSPEARAGQPATDTRKVSPPATSAVDVAALLSRFDSFMSRADHAGARRYAEAEAAKPVNKANARMLEAAARVAKALETRPAAIRKGARSLVGKEVKLRLKTGSGAVTTGEIKKVTDDGLVVATAYYINRQRRERTAPLSWDALHPEQEDKFAEKGGWEVPAAGRAVARAWVAFASGDLDAAESAAGDAKGHPLAEYLKGRVAEARVEAAYTAAMDRARARMGLRNWKGAVEAARGALEAKPDDAEAKKLLVEAKSHIGPAPTLTLDLGPRPDGRPGKVTMEFVYIKPGVFMMGATEDPKHGWQGVERPKHEVAITRGFYIGRYEVTRGQFAAFVKATGHRTNAEKEGKAWARHPDGKWRDTARVNWLDPKFFTQTDDHPVMAVSWNDVKAFCDWAAAKTRRDVRLPTEAEWEFAARAGSTARYCFGDSEGGLGAYAWYGKNSNWQTHPVGQKRANAWGLHDVHGNVWEWVADWYDAGYYAKSPRENPAGPDSGRDRLLRGGCWYRGSFECRSAIRLHRSPSNRYTYEGFRAAVSVSAAQAGATGREAARRQAAYAKAMNLAKIRIRFRNWKGAAEAAKRALEAKPDDAEATKLLVEAESHIGPAPTLTLDLGRGVTMDLVYIKPGVFVMGGNEDPKYGWQGVEKPKHEVAITRGFYIGRYEVTRGQFAAFVKATGHRTEAEREGKSWGPRADGSQGEIAGASWRDPVVFAQTDGHPVMCVSWNDVKAFCEWAAAKTRRGVRLPTEAEWEYAARAGSTTRYCFGDSEGGLDEFGWHRGNSGTQTHPVGQKKPNQWGLYDVHGNVWEWVADSYAADYYAKSPRENPTGPDAEARRLLRGGGWFARGYLCRSALRVHLSPSVHYPHKGFRACVSSSPTPQR